MSYVCKDVETAKTQFAATRSKRQGQCAIKRLPGHVETHEKQKVAYCTAKGYLLRCNMPPFTT